MNKPEHTPLPNWLYPLGFWLGLILLGTSIFIPQWSWLGVIWLGALPVIAALWVAIASWSYDRQLSFSALAALGGLGIVFFIKAWI